MASASVSASSSVSSELADSPEDSPSSVDSAGGTSPLYSKSEGSSSSRSGANLPASWPSSIQSDLIKCCARRKRCQRNRVGRRSNWAREDARAYHAQFLLPSEVGEAKAKGFNPTARDFLQSLLEVSSRYPPSADAGGISDSRHIAYAMHSAL